MEAQIFTNIGVALVLVLGIAVVSVNALAVIVLLRTGSLRDMIYFAEVIRAFRVKNAEKSLLSQLWRKTVREFEKTRSPRTVKQRSKK